MTTTTTRWAAAESPPHIDESGLVGRAVPERPTDRVVRNIAILRLCISDES